MTTFPTLVSCRCVYVTVSHVNYTGTPKWNVLEGTTAGKGKAFGFSTFLCVKMWIQELDLKHHLARDGQAMGREFSEDTEEFGF